jgi:hypothetical protein
MAIPNNKQELVNAISVNAEKLFADLTTIPASKAKTRSMEGHSKGEMMSVCEAVAYLIGWGELVLKWNRKKEAGEEVHFPEENFKWNELGKLAQKFYRDYASDDYKTLLIKFDSVVTRILELVKHKTNQQLYHTTWYEQWTPGRLIQLNTASPYTNTKARIRKWKKTNGIL